MANRKEVTLKFRADVSEAGKLGPNGPAGKALDGLKKKAGEAATEIAKVSKPSASGANLFKGISSSIDAARKSLIALEDGQGRVTKQASKMRKEFGSFIQNVASLKKAGGIEEFTKGLRLAAQESVRLTVLAKKLGFSEVEEQARGLTKELIAVTQNADKAFASLGKVAGNAAAGGVRVLPAAMPKPEIPAHIAQAMAAPLSAEVEKAAVVVKKQVAEAATVVTKAVKEETKAKKESVVQSTASTKAVQLELSAKQESAQAEKQVAASVAKTSVETKKGFEFTGKMARGFAIANDAKHDFHVNLGRLNISLAQFGHFTELSTKSLGATGIAGAFQNAGSVMNSIFVKSMERSADRNKALIGSLDASKRNVVQFGNAFTRAMREAEAAGTKVTKTQQRLAREIAQSGTFKDEFGPRALQMARMLVDLQVKGLGPVTAMKKVRESHLKIENDIANKIALQVIGMAKSQEAEARLLAMAELRQQKLAKLRTGQLLPSEMGPVRPDMAVLNSMREDLVAKINPATSALQAYNTTLALTSSFSEASAAHTQALTRTMADLEAVARREAQAMGLSAEATERLVQNVRNQGVAALEAFAQSAGRVAGSLQTMNTSAEFFKAFTAEMDRSMNMSKAMDAGFDGMKASAEALNAQVDILREKFKVTNTVAMEMAQGLAAGDVNMERLKNSTERTTRSLTQFSANSQFYTAFNKVYAETGDIVRSNKAGLVAAAEVQGRLASEAQRLARAHGVSKAAAESHIKVLSSGGNATQSWTTQIERARKSMRLFGFSLDDVNDGMTKTNGLLSKVGAVFAGLFVVDRIKQIFDSLIHTFIDLAKLGSEVQATQLSLAVTARRLGISWEEVTAGVNSFGDSLLSTKTVLVAMRSLLGSGLNVDETVRLMRGMEEATLRANFATKGLQDRITDAAEAFRDRMSRSLGMNTTLQTNYGQSVRISSDVLKDQLKNVDRLRRASAAMGAQTSLDTESMKWFAAIMQEATLATGTLAAITDTTQGQLALLDKQISNLKVAIGTVLAPVLGAVVKIMNTKLLPVLIEWVTNNQALVRSLSVMAVMIAAIASAASGAAISFVSFAFALSLGSPVGWTLAAIAAVAAASTLAITTQGADRSLLSLGNTVGRIVEGMKTFVKVMNVAVQIIGLWRISMGGAVKGIGDLGMAITQFLIPPLALALRMIAIIKPQFKDAIDAVLIMTESMMQPMVDRTGGEVDEFRRRLKEQIKATKQEVEEMEDVVKQAKKNGPGAIANAWGKQNLKDALGNVEAGIAGNNELSKTDKWSIRASAIGDAFSKTMKQWGGKSYEQLISSFEEGLQKKKVKLSALEAALSLRDLPALAEHAGEETEAEMRKLLRSLDEIMNGFELGEAEKKFITFGEGSAKAVENMVTRMRTALLGLIGSFSELASFMRDQFSEIFMGQSLEGQMSQFDRRFADMFRRFDQAIKSRELRLDGLKQAMADDKGAINPKALEELLDTQKMVDRFGELGEKMKELQEVARKGFLRQAADSEISSLKSVINATGEARKAIALAESSQIATLFAQRIRSIEEIARVDERYSRAASELKVALEKAAAVEILRATSETFNIVISQVEALVTLVADEVKTLFSLVERERKRDERAQQARNQAQQVISLRQRERELIDSVNATSRTEEERQIRILAIQRETNEQIRMMHEDAAKSSESIWMKFIDSVSGALIDRLAKNAIGKVTDAIAGLFGGDKGLLADAKVQVDLGTDAEKYFAQMAAIEWGTTLDKQQIALDSIDSTLKTIAAKFGASPGETAGMFGASGSPVGSPGSRNEQQKSVVLEESRAKLVDTLNTISKAVTVATIGFHILGVRMPRVLSTFMNLVAAVRIAIQALRSLAQAREVMGFIGTAVGLAAGGPAGGIAPSPFMAAGGVVRRATRAVVGEAGPEMILPLNARSMDMLAMSLYRASNRREYNGTSARMMSSMGDRGGINMVINVGAGAADRALASELRVEVEKTVTRLIKRRTIGMGGMS